VIKSAEMLVLLCSASLLAGCGGEKPVGPSTGIATRLVKSPSSDAQAWYFNNALPVTLGVAALDVNSRPVSGVIVTWASASGGATVTPAVDTTDANGVVSATFMLGPTSTAQSITATSNVAGLPTLTFTATASAPPTTATVRVQDFSYNKPTATVQVGGTVTWQWVGADDHSVSFGYGNAPTSPIQMVGDYKRTFTTAGTFDYFCKVHGAAMSGSVTVVN
jgi:plastocyanin